MFTISLQAKMAAPIHEQDNWKFPEPNMATDWRGTKSVTGCLEALCLTERMADVTFSFPGSDVIVHAHKFVLSLRSEVFEAMFYGPMAEQRQDTSIRIEDSDPESFKLFLRYVYTDATDFKNTTLMEYLYLGRKYCVESLVRACSLYLETTFSVANVFTIFELAEQFAMPELQEKCLVYMADHAEDVFKSEEFLSKSCEFLAQFFARDYINAREGCVFETAVQWAKRQCAKSGEDESPENLRRCLGDAFYCIRLPTMPIDSFADVVNPSGFLSADEQNHLYRHITDGSYHANPVPETVARFPTDRRKPRLATIDIRNNDYEQNNASDNSDICDLTKYVQMTIASSIPLKLFSVSGDIIDKGIQSVRLNAHMLVKNTHWQVRNKRLEIINGYRLRKDEDNMLLVSLRRHIINVGVNKHSFEAFGGKGKITYPTYEDCRFDCMVFAEEEYRFPDTRYLLYDCYRFVPPAFND